MPENEKALVIAGREDLKRDRIPSDVIPGAKVIDGDCGCRVWVSPTTQQMIAEYGENGSYVSCMECIMTDPEQLMMLMTSLAANGANVAPGGFEEFDKNVGVAERKALEAHLGIKERKPKS